VSGISTIEGALRVRGQLFADSLSLPANSVGDAEISSADPITADKLEHQHMPGWAQPNTTATAETRAIHVARGPGTIEAFQAGSIAKCVGDSTVTVDLRKNGTTVLSSVITLDSGNTNRVVETGTLSGSPTVVAGDVLEVVIAISAGTGTLATGVFCQAVVREQGS
jgi:hypothetical protein